MIRLLFIAAMLALVAPSAADYSVTVQTPHYQIEAMDCADVVAFTWVEPGDRHLGKLSAESCDTFIIRTVGGYSPGSGDHAVTVNLFNLTGLLWLECMVTGMERTNGVRIDVFCQDDPIFSARRR